MFPSFKSDWEQRQSLPIILVLYLADQICEQINRYDDDALLACDVGNLKTFMTAYAMDDDLRAQVGNNFVAKCEICKTAGELCKSFDVYLQSPEPSIVLVSISHALIH